MLKPFYNKKKNIDDRLVPAVSVADAGKFLGVTEDGKIAPVEGGGGNVVDVFTTSINDTYLYKTRACLVSDRISDYEGAREFFNNKPVILHIISGEIVCSATSTEYDVIDETFRLIASVKNTNKSWAIS